MSSKNHPSRPYLAQAGAQRSRLSREEAPFKNGRLWDIYSK